MKIVAFIEEAHAIEKILRHSVLRSSATEGDCELWKVPEPHPPPAKSIEPPKIESDPVLDYQFTSARLSAAL